MIEAYAFLAMFTVQILAMSVLYPAWFIRRARVQARSAPNERLAERLAQLYPGVDLALARERFFSRYRAGNTVIAALGLLLLGWLFNYMRHPGWDDDDVATLAAVYFVLQIVPICIVGLIGVVYIKTHKHALLEGKRKATLQRRGLFDFVSPFTFFLVVLAYFLFVAFVIYLKQQPTAGSLRSWQGSAMIIVAVTLVYAVNGFTVYRLLYGAKCNPFETHAARLHTLGRTVKGSVYSCLISVVFLSLFFTLNLLELQKWQPFALSVFLVITTLLSLRSLNAPPRRPEAGGPGSDGRLPGTRDLPA